MNFLRYILALLMLCIFIFRDFSRPIIAADYLVNMDRYRQACINKLKPKSGCNGRCQMMRKMGASEGASSSEAVPPIKPFSAKLFLNRWPCHAISGHFHFLSAMRCLSIPKTMCLHTWTTFSIPRPFDAPFILMFPVLSQLLTRPSSPHS